MIQGRRTLKRILIFLSLKSLVICLMSDSPTYLFHPSYAGSPLESLLTHMTLCGRFFFLRHAYLAALQYSAQQKVGPSFDIGFLHLALVPILPFLSGPQSLKFSFISYRAGQLFLYRLQAIQGYSQGFIFIINFKMCSVYS